MTYRFLERADTKLKRCLERHSDRRSSQERPLSPRWTVQSRVGSLHCFHIGRTQHREPVLKERVNRLSDSLSTLPTFVTVESQPGGQWPSARTRSDDNVV